LPRTLILLISASQVAWNTGISYWHLALPLILNTYNLSAEDSSKQDKQVWSFLYLWNLYSVKDLDNEQTNISTRYF
jgi:hypothetical protein